jgi:hypothetical protein
MRIGARSHILTAGGGAICLSTFLGAQAGQPARDAQRKPEASGTGVITGTLVTDDSSARPIRRAVVNLSGSDFLRTRMTVTDDAGRFTLSSLPASNFSLWAAKPGYVSAYYGSRRPGRGPGIPIALTDGQTVTVTLKMLRGAVITGTITDSTGRPAQAQIQLFQYQMVGGERVLQNARFISGGSISPLGLTTDDRGMYRLYGLAPGDYVVSASVRPTPGDLRPVAPGEIQWARQITQPGGASGGNAPPPQAQTVGYSPVFFPGTVDPAAASVVSVGAGEERGGVDFALQLVPTARVQGTVVDADGRRATGAQVSLVPKTIVASSLSMSMPRATVTNGQFVVSGVTPGTYVVTARGRGAGPAGAPAGGRGASGPSLWAMAEINVAGQDLPKIEMRLEPGMSIAGRFVFETASGQPPSNVNNFRASMGTFQSGTGPTVSVSVPAAPADAEGRFRFGNVMPGTYQVSAFGGAVISNQGPAWVMKSVTAGGRDITDGPFEVRAREDVPEIVITFTDRTTEVTGTLFDAAGRPSSGLSIIMFTANRALWGTRSRRTMPATAASDGKFRLAGLPPGEYYMAAVTEFEYPDLSDPSFLEQLSAGAFKITLAEGEKKVQDIRMGGS